MDGPRIDITDQEKAATYAWPYIGAFDNYDNGSLSATITIDGPQLSL